MEQREQREDIHWMLAAALTNCVQDKAVTGWRYTLTADIALPIPPELAPPVRPGTKCRDAGEEGKRAGNAGVGEEGKRAGEDGAPSGVFEGEWVSFRRDAENPGWWVLVVRRPYSTDGCTLVKDFSSGATLSRCLHVLRHEGARAALRLAGPFVASWGHDPGFQFAVEFAKAWRCSVWAVIRYWNAYFGWVMRVCETPRRQRVLYERGVQVLGHPFAWLGRRWRALRSAVRAPSARTQVNRTGTQCRYAGEDRRKKHEHE